jgi:integrative and conjugative element protein (TIGR02256 family)
MQRDVKLPIRATALDSIVSTIRSSDSRLETGGALFGPPDGSSVLHAVGPGPNAEHGPRSFRRDLVFTQHEAVRLYQADRSHWIGEWHTHIDVPATPSELDLHTYAKHIADPDLRFDRFLALIIATSGSQPLLAAWILERRGHELVLTQACTQILDRT